MVIPYPLSPPPPKKNCSSREYFGMNFTGGKVGYWWLDSG